MPVDGMSLTEAATQLGVHYQTAYKWVRAGRLPATRVRGAYELDPGEVDAFAARRDRPADAPARRPRQGYAALAERLHDHLLAGEEPAAPRLVAGLIDNGVAAVTGDRNALATSMAATALRDDNWHVEHLGADVPPAEIERFGMDNDVDLYVLTVAVPAVRSTAEELARRLGARGRPDMNNTQFG